VLETPQRWIEEQASQRTGWEASFLKADAFIVDLANPLNIGATLYRALGADAGLFAGELSPQEAIEKNVDLLVEALLMELGDQLGKKISPRGPGRPPMFPNRAWFVGKIRRNLLLQGLIRKAVEESGGWLYDRLKSLRFDARFVAASGSYGLKTVGPPGNDK